MKTMKQIILIAVFLFVLLSAAPVPVSLAQTVAAGQSSRIAIPSIKLAALIQPVGTDPDGSMSVPVTPNTVGWYAGGTAPGELGSAVLDAHVYLAFKNLKQVKKGASIYVTKSDGTKLRFVVSGAKTYADDKVPLRMLFASNDAKRLNLITCAGKWLPSQGTYDHRLIVFAKLAN